MERLYQMNVVPDILPVIKPSLDLHVVAKSSSREYFDDKKLLTTVVPGIFLTPRQVMPIIPLSIIFSHI
jgi:large subunit ribosomal protein L35